MEDSWDELGTHYVKGKKPFTKDFVLLESIQRKVQNGQIYIETETLGTGRRGSWRKWRKRLLMGTGLWGVKELF